MLTTKEYVELYMKSPFYNNYDGSEKDKELIVEYNKSFINRYPFLLPRNRWTGEIVSDYDYSYTEMDSMSEGWRIAFGDKMLEELKEELEKFNFLNEYRILEIKEKYGTLRWYDCGFPSGSKVYDIINKYEKESANYCIRCGASNPEYVSKGWISYYCKDCANEIYNSKEHKYGSFEHFFCKKDEMDDEY